MILGGVLANQHKLPLAAVLVAGIAGAVLGDTIGYLVGALRRAPARQDPQPDPQARARAAHRADDPAPARKGRATRPVHRSPARPHPWHGRDVRGDLPHVPALERARRAHLGRRLRRARLPRRQPIPAHRALRQLHRPRSTRRHRRLPRHPTPPRCLGHTRRRRDPVASQGTCRPPGPIPQLSRVRPIVSGTHLGFLASGRDSVGTIATPHPATPVRLPGPAAGRARSDQTDRMPSGPTRRHWRCCRWSSPA